MRRQMMIGWVLAMVGVVAPEAFAADGCAPDVDGLSAEEVIETYMIDEECAVDDLLDDAETGVINPRVWDEGPKDPGEDLPYEDRVKLYEVRASRLRGRDCNDLVGLVNDGIDLAKEGLGRYKLSGDVTDQIFAGRAYTAAEAVRQYAVDKGCL